MWVAPAAMSATPVRPATSAGDHESTVAQVSAVVARANLRAEHLAEHAVELLGVARRATRPIAIVKMTPSLIRKGFNFLVQLRRQLHRKPLLEKRYFFTTLRYFSG